MYRYETHCHTAPVSRCAKASAEDTVRFYQSLGYDGVFITNHFLDGNINPEIWKLSYQGQIDYYFRDYEDAARAGKRLGIKVFPGVELVRASLLRLQSLLIRVLFPTLLFPATAIWGRPFPVNGP